MEVWARPNTSSQLYALLFQYFMFKFQPIWSRLKIPLIYAISMFNIQILNMQYTFSD